MGFRVQGIGFRVSGVGYGVEGTCPDTQWNERRRFGGMSAGAWWIRTSGGVHLERQVGLVLVHLEDGAAHITARNIRERRQRDRRAAHVSAHSPLVPRRERHGVDLEEHLALPFGEDRPLAGVRHLQDVVRTAVLGDLHRLHRGHCSCKTACRKKVDCEEREWDI